MKAARNAVFYNYKRQRRRLLEKSLMSLSCHGGDGDVMHYSFVLFQMPGGVQIKLYHYRWGNRPVRRFVVRLQKRNMGHKLAVQGGYIAYHQTLRIAERMRGLSNAADKAASAVRDFGQFGKHACAHPYVQHNTPPSLLDDRDPVTSLVIEEHSPSVLGQDQFCAFYNRRMLFPVSPLTATEAFELAYEVLSQDGIVVTPKDVTWRLHPAYIT